MITAMPINKAASLSFTVAFRFPLPSPASPPASGKCISMGLIMINYLPDCYQIHAELIRTMCNLRMGFIKFVVDIGFDDFDGTEIDFQYNKVYVNS